MKDMQASLKRLRADAAETAPKRDLATDTQSESCHQTGGSLSKRAKNNRIVSLESLTGSRPSAGRPPSFRYLFHINAYSRPSVQRPALWPYRCYWARLRYLRRKCWHHRAVTVWWQHL
jgi:hypothetical protein